MSRLNSTAEPPIKVEDPLAHKLEPWINNPPEYDDMITTYKRSGRLKALIRRKKRDIERQEDAITILELKPRSNEAKKAKLDATTELKDDLADLEAELEVVEMEVKALEFMKTMFNASNYRTRLSETYA